MAFQPVEATALIELIQFLDNQVIENTLYFRQANDYDAADLEALALNLSVWWAVNIRPQMASTLSLVGVRATALHDQTGPQFISTVGLPSTGAVLVDSVPNNSAFCLSFRTALIGRAFRGRNYISGLPESVVTMSRLAGATATALQTAYEQIQPGLPAGTTWVVVSRTVNGVLQSVGLTNQVTSVVFQDLNMDSQRRRLPGRGT
jgi:hypothetical protein